MIGRIRIDVAVNYNQRDTKVLLGSRIELPKMGTTSAVSLGDTGTVHTGDRKAYRVGSLRVKAVRFGGTLTMLPPSSYAGCFHSHTVLSSGRVPWKVPNVRI